MNNERHSIPDSDASEETEDLESLRPNRWKGAPSTWSTLTEQERGLAASLDQIRNTDLSIHLYNAHALKRRAREFEEDPEKVKKEHPAVPDEDQTFKPPKYWTAWPLPPNEVPREGERIGPEDPNEKYTFKRREVQRPSRVLEDVLLGVTLRFAKERFMGRDEEGLQDDEARSPKDYIRGHERGDGSRSPDSEELSDRSEHIVIKEGSAPPSAEILKPVISADDDRSRKILRPSIRHSLSKLDEMLMALHHARKTCRRYSNSSATSANSSDEENTNRGHSISPQKRPQGRPRNFADLPDRSRAQSIPTGEDADLLRGKRTHLGRPLKVYERLEGEAQEDYLVRIARIQKRPLPTFAPPTETKYEERPSPAPRKSSRSPGRRVTSDELAARRRKKLNTRDWSEVLSSAALAGFPPDAIARATQRCANIFGEGMTMRHIVETPFIEKVPDTLARYIPEEIPNLDEEIVLSSSDDYDSSADSSSDSQIKTEQPDPQTLRRARVPPSKQTCFCPMPNCPRRTQGFRDNSALRRHIELGHKIAKEEVDDYLLPSDEEMDGAVHVDGFLKPLKRLGGARGAYKKTAAKRTRVEESSDDDDDEDEEMPETLHSTLAIAPKQEKPLEESSEDEESSSTSDS